MSKYDAKLDFNSVNSLSIIANNIQSNSIILEFGPATGRLTQYLKNELDCKVYIVEIDSTGYDKAIQYAEDGYLGDIEQYKWFKKFQTIQFDYIIFADVLEHLRNPQKVIEYSQKILSDRGKLIISVPNVAHNSIIFNLLKDEFQYNKLGLLDDTHIHLFTYETAKRLIENEQFTIIKEEATYSKEEPNEFPYSLNDCNQYQFEVLDNHPKGQIYQYIFTAMKKECMNDSNISIQNLIEDRRELESCTLYFDLGDGFSQDFILQRPITTGFNNITFDLNQYGKVYAIRIDFFESYLCLVSIDSIKIDGEIVELGNMNGNFSGGYKEVYVFNHKDPFINFTIEPKKISRIEIQFHINKIFNDQQIIGLHLEKYCQLAPLVELKENHIVNIENLLKHNNTVLGEKDKIIENLNTSIRIKDEAIDNQSKDIDNLNEKIEENIYKINQLNHLVLEVKDEIKNKENQLFNLENELKLQNHNITMLNEIIEKKNLTLDELNKNLIEANKKIQMFKRALKNPFYGLYLLSKKIRLKLGIK